MCTREGDEAVVVKQEKYGVDVAVTRADDLDKKMLATVSAETGLRVLDVGCGAGGQSLRLVQAGAFVVSLDIFDYSDAFRKLRQKHELSEELLHFIRGDMTDAKNLLTGRKFDFCCVQRAIHYLPYYKAKQFLEDLRQIVSGNLYISVTGIGSAIGENYGDKDKNVSERFCQLGLENAETFNIHEPVCLYTKEEFEDLFRVSGWEIEESWVSAFGNVKIISN